MKLYTRYPLSSKCYFETLKRHKFTCKYCGRKAPEVQLEVDHVIPISKGGTNHPNNLVAACYDCNRGKRDRLMAPATPFARFCEAYIAMWKETKYRPWAPNDGGRGIDYTDEQLADPELLAREAKEYAAHFIKEEDSHKFWVGCSNYETNRAFVYAIEAARILCRTFFHRKIAIKLLEMALAEVKRAENERQTKRTV